MTTRRLPTLIALLLLSLVAGACSALPGGPERLTVTAEFDDVLDLVPAAHVRAGDVPIGTVDDIELTPDGEALVTMSIEPGTGLPSDVQAALAKTSLLGERFVDLRPTGESGAIEDGQHIDDTTIVRDFEDLVRSGNDALAFVAAEQLAIAVQTGAETFGGRASLIGGFIEDVNAVVGSYEEGAEDLTALIDSLDGLTAEMAPDVETNAEALALLQETAESLDAQDERLMDALDDVSRLSVVGGRILDDHERQLDNLVRRIRIITSEINRIPNALQLVLTYVPRHNLHVPNGINKEEAQVWLDFIVCGFQDTDGDPSRDCTPPNPGERAPGPGFSPGSESCDESHEGCPVEPAVDDDDHDASGGRRTAGTSAREGSS